MTIQQSRQNNFIISKTAAARILELSAFSVRFVTRTNNSNSIDIETVQGNQYQIP